MRRAKEIDECKQHLEDETTEHLHIRRRVIATEFRDEFVSGLDDYNLISVDIGTWDYDNLVHNIRWEVQKQLSIPRYILSRLKNLGFSIAGTGPSGGLEAKPDYDRTSKYLAQVAGSEQGVIVLLDYTSEEPIDGFAWLDQLDVPPSVTIVTEGFRRCHRDESKEVSVGRLKTEQAVEYIRDLRPDLDREEAVNVHELHDGNPAAIQMAHDRGAIEEPLTGDALDKLWMQVYDDKISAEEYDLLKDSAHLIDLDTVDVATVSNKSRGEARDLLKSLESKGVVSRRKSRLFNTDKYVTEYISSQFCDESIVDKHRTVFKNHAENWVSSYNSRMQEMRSSSKDDEDTGPSLPDFDAGVADTNLFIAAHHLSEMHSELDREKFVNEIQAVDADTSGLFAFGMITQRFFFEEPTEVIQDLSEGILGIDEDIENEFFSGTLGVFFDFDFGEYVAELSKGWSEESIETSNLNINWSEPDNIIERLGENIDLELYDELPPNVKKAVLYFIAIPFTDTRTARDYYRRFGTTALDKGLEEEPFKDWLEEMEVLLDDLTVEADTEDTDSRRDPHERGLEELQQGIRDRIELEEYLTENHSQAQTQFQHRLERIRERPEEITQQYVRCGEELERMENEIFAYLWYAVGHHLFSKLVLGEPRWAIHGKYQRLSGKREEYERGQDTDELVIPMEEVETRLSPD
jgi:hypothetical protein